jgi:xylan 1,4-beta-xylosidase
MGLAEQLRAADTGFKIVAGFPEWRNTPVILDENDPEGCAGCSPKNHPEDNYRNDPIYAVYTVLDIEQTEALAARDGVTLRGAVTWAFQFEGQPYFAGYRDLATNGIDKPVLNGFRALGLLGDVKLEATNSAAVSAETIQRNGVPSPVIDVIAARKPSEVEVLLLQYRDDNVASPTARIMLALTGLPAGARTVRVDEFRVDASHSNAFAVWRATGSPQNPTTTQYRVLEKAGQLQHVGAIRQLPVRKRTLQVDLDVPIEGLALIRATW